MARLGWQLRQSMPSIRGIGSSSMFFGGSEHRTPIRGAALDPGDQRWRIKTSARAASAVAHITL